MASGTGTVERELEPWSDHAFRADLRAYADGGADLSRRFAADAVLLARLAARIPRADGDTRGATAWTSFLAEVAVARRASSQWAASAVSEAQQLVRLMPRTLDLLQQGLLAVPRARALVDATRPCSDELVRLVDAELAGRAVDLVPGRIRAAVDRFALQHDVDAAAQRAAVATASRGTRRTPLPDAQAELALTGPALVLAQVGAALDADARAWLAALRGTGDGRGVDQLRFDLAVHRLLGAHAPLVASPPAAVPAAPAPAAAGLPDALAVPLPDAGSPCWWTDRRFTRPVRLDIAVPVTTALGLSDEPGWLPGYGWVAAPLVRQLLPVSELRQSCVAADGPAAGQLVDLADRAARPVPTAAGARAVLVEMASAPFDVTDKTWRWEPRHDPSPALDEFVRLRDRHCDGPVGGRPLPATGGDLDHDRPYDHDAPAPPTPAPLFPPPPTPASPTAAPTSSALAGASAPVRTRHDDLGLALDPATGWLTLTDLGDPGTDGSAHGEAAAGPTAAWNLVGRGRRSHGLKHRGWTPLRTATSTLWFTPAGQTVEVPHDLHPPRPVDGGRPLPDAEQLHAREAVLLETVVPPVLEEQWPLEQQWPDAVREAAGAAGLGERWDSLVGDDEPPF